MLRRVLPLLCCHWLDILNICGTRSLMFLACTEPPIYVVDSAYETELIIFLWSHLHAVLPDQ